MFDHVGTFRASLTHTGPVERIDRNNILKLIVMVKERFQKTSHDPRNAKDI